MELKKLALALFVIVSFQSLSGMEVEKAIPIISWKLSDVVNFLGLIKNEHPTLLEQAKAYDNIFHLMEEQVKLVEIFKRMSNILQEAKTINGKKISLYISIPKSLKDTSLVINNRDIFKKRLDELTPKDIDELQQILFKSTGELSKSVQNAYKHYYLITKFKVIYLIALTFQEYFFKNLSTLTNEAGLSSDFKKTPLTYLYELLEIIIKYKIPEEQKALEQPEQEKQEYLNLLKALLANQKYIDSINEILKNYNDNRSKFVNFYNSIVKNPTFLKIMTLKYSTFNLWEKAYEKIIEDNFNTLLEHEISPQFFEAKEEIIASKIEQKKPKATKKKKKKITTTEKFPEKESKQEIEADIEPIIEVGSAKWFNDNFKFDDQSKVTFIDNDYGIVTIEDPTKQIEIKLVLPDPKKEIDLQCIVKGLDYHERVLGWLENPTQMLINSGDLQKHETLNQLTPKKQSALRKKIYRHNFAQMVDPFIIEYGEDNIFTDKQGNEISNKTLFGQIIDKKTGEEMNGVFGYGRIPDSNVWYHRFFTQKTPEAINQEYVQKARWELEFPPLGA